MTAPSQLSNRLASLMRAGVIKAQELPTLKMALQARTRVGGDFTKLTKQHRDVLSKFYNSTTTAALGTSVSFNSMRGNIGEETLEEGITIPPAQLVLKRTAIRQFPDGTNVASYKSDKLDLTFTVPYSSHTGFNQKIVPGVHEEVEENVQEETLNEQGAPLKRPYHPSAGDLIRPKRGGRYEGVVEKVDRNFVYFKHVGDAKVYRTHVNNVRKVPDDQNPEMIKKNKNKKK